MTIKQLLKMLLTESVLQIEPTRRCNFNCLHCTHKGNGGDLSIDVYERLLEKHKQCKVVKLQGLGEPLLHPDIQVLIDMAKIRGHKVMVITNGTLRYVNNVDYYVFSLETMIPEVFESIGKKNLLKVLENIRDAASRQKVIINCVQCVSTTPEDVAAVKHFAKDIGADIWITPQEVWVDVSHPEHTEQVENTKRAWQRHGINRDYKKYLVCNWGVSEFYYDYSGVSHPCCIRMTDEYKNQKPSFEICKNCPL